MSTWIVAPVLVPLGTAILGLVGWGRPRFQRGLGVGGALALLASAVALFAEVRSNGIVAVQIGDWPAPFGISLVADLFSAVMVLVTAVIGVAITLCASDEADDDAVANGYFPFVHVLLVGVCGAFLTGDLFNLYVWFEVMLLASFVLLAVGGQAPALRSGVSYVTLNLLASAFFLVAIGALYGLAGTLNFADLAAKLPAGEPGGSRIVAALLLVAFGIKAGLFPVFFWLPASYPHAGFAVSALFAGLLTKVGVYALIRVFTLLFPLDDAIAPLLTTVAAATMLAGVLAAAAQGHLRRILSFHIVSQIGYMVLGLALSTPLALAAAIFYVVHHIITKANLFLVSGLIAGAGGSEELGRIGGLGRGPLALSILFAVPALSLAGIPPFSGFFAKLFLIRAGLDAGAFAWVAIALIVSLFTLFSMAKIWREAFWKPSTPEQGRAGGSLPRATVLASGGLALLTVCLGVGAELLWTVAQDAAAQLVDPTGYIEAVRGPAT